MPAPNPRRLAPGRVCQLLNSFPQTGTVLTPSRLRQIRHEAGAAICGSDPETGMPDFQSVHLLKLTAWLCVQRHGQQVKKERHVPASGSLDSYIDEKWSALGAILESKITI